MNQKLHSTRYAVTAAMGTFAISCLTIAIPESASAFKIPAAIFGAVFVGLFCNMVIPYHDRGDN